MTLPTVIAPLDPGHIDDHQEIHTLLGRLDGQGVVLATGVGQLNLASRPAAGAANLGLMWYAPDVPALYYSDGAAWRQFVQATTANLFTAINQFQSDVFFGSGKPWVDPMHNAFGGVGDGIANENTALQAAATAAAGKILFFSPGTSWKVTTTITIPANTDVIAHRAAVFNNTAAATVISLLSGCRVWGLEVYSNGSAASYNDLSRCISIVGTVGSYRTNVLLADVYVHNASYGIYSDFASDVTVSNPRVFDVAYGGIGGTSVSRFHVLNPNVNMNNPVGTAGNAYGIYFSRSTPPGSDLTSNPRSTDCSVIGGVVRNVQIWHGLDTHAGDQINFIGVTVLNCLRGAHIGPGNDGAGVPTYAPRRCNVDLVIDSQVTDGSRDNGIIVQGAASVEYAEGIRVRATIKGHGNQSLDPQGGFYAYYTRGLQADITVIECSRNGVVLAGENDDFNLTVMSEDPWSTASRGTHIFVTGGNNRGTIGSYTMGRGGKAAAFVDTEGLRVDNTAGNYIELGVGTCSSATPLIDAGALVRSTMRGAITTPASRAAVAGLNVPHGAAPTVPVNGDVWTTTAGIFVRINGATVGPLS